MEKKDKIKTYEDACEVLGIEPAKGIVLNPDEEEKASNAFTKLMRIAKALNDGWKPNWKDSDEYKYSAWFDMKDDNGSGLGLSCDDYGYVSSGSAVGSRLVFRTSELAKYAGKQFAAIYADMMVIPD